MKFSRYCKYLEEFEALSSRNEMTVKISELLKELEKDELKAGLFLLQGKIAPQYIESEFNFSTKLMLRGLVDIGNEESEVKNLFLEAGDIGLAMAQFVKWEGDGLELNVVFKDLQTLAKLSGKNSQSLKIDEFKKLYKRLSALEAKYMGRIINGKLRLGASDKTIIDALSWAIKGDKSLKPKIERAYGAMADLSKIAEIVLFENPDNLEHINPIPGVPVSSKLVEREKTLKKIFDRLGGGLIVQPKYDGLRMQIHITSDAKKEPTEQIDILATKSRVRLYSRNMSEITKMFPDIVKTFENSNLKDTIIDSEVIGVNIESGLFLPFQETIQRKRKHGVSQKSEEIPVQMFCFDVMMHDGVNLMNETLTERLHRLEEILAKLNIPTIHFSESTIVASPEELEKIYEKHKALGLEGIIVKNPDSIYEPGSRNYEWIKFKVKSEEGLADTVDAVILGYYRGTGVRAKFGLGAILVGVYDYPNEKFVSITKVGTGFKDEDLKLLRSRLDELKIQEVPENVEIHKLLMPDVLVQPELVCVIEADEITKSKVHGGIGGGLSLRFPRFKYLRADKSAVQATTIDELKSMQT
jgi:DNA ligase 1